MKRSGFPRKKTPLKTSPLKKKPTSQLKRTEIKRKRRKKVIRQKQSSSPLWRSIKKCDNVFSQMVRLLQADKFGEVRCYTCDFKAFWKLSGIENGHFLSRTQFQTRWFLPNCKGQCKKCNSFLRGNLKVFAANLIKEYGPNIINFLERESKKKANLTIPMLKNMTKYFEAEVVRLKKQLHI